MRKALACLLLLGCLMAAATAEAAVYNSALGYSIALPDDSWFLLDEESYAASAGALFPAVCLAGDRRARPPVQLAENDMEYFFSLDAPDRAFGVWKRPLMGEEGVRQTIETLREGLPEGTSFAGGQIAIGETAYEGFQCILDGQLVTGLFAEGGGGHVFGVFPGRGFGQRGARDDPGGVRMMRELKKEAFAIAREAVAASMPDEAVRRALGGAGPGKGQNGGRGGGQGRVADGAGRRAGAGGAFGRGLCHHQVRPRAGRTSRLSGL